MKLYAPLTYWKASYKEKAKVCNGCGAKDGIKVPDTMWGLNISNACNIHDWMWNEGETLADFFFSNAVFIMNLALIIVSANKWIAPLRLLRATKYFVAVQELGEHNYWVEGKKKNNRMEITYKGKFQ